MLEFILVINIDVRNLATRYTVPHRGPPAIQLQYWHFHFGWQCDKCPEAMPVPNAEYRCCFALGLTVSPPENMVFTQWFISTFAYQSFHVNRIEMVLLIKTSFSDKWNFLTTKGKISVRLFNCVLIRKCHQFQIYNF